MLMFQEPDVDSPLYKALFKTKDPFNECVGGGTQGSVHTLRNTDLVAKISCLNREVQYRQIEGHSFKPVEVHYEQGMLQIDGEEYSPRVDSEGYRFSLTPLVERQILRYINMKYSGDGRTQHLCHLVEDYVVSYAGDIYLILVEERAPGERLQGLGAFSEEETARLALSLSPLFSFFRRRGIIHRDVKPGNIHYTSSTHTSTRKATLLDFGTATFSEKGLRGISDPLTCTLFSEHKAIERSLDIVAGTPAYVSPEQARGEELTPASDLYSLGLILVERLTGTMVNYGASPLEVMEKAATFSNPLRTSALGLLRECQISPLLEEGIESLLATKPEDRLLYPLHTGARKLLNQRKSERELGMPSISSLLESGTG